MEKRTMMMAIAFVIAVVGIVTVFVVTPFTFKGKVEILSQSYEVLEIPLSTYDTYYLGRAIDVYVGAEETKNWSLFKSKLKQATYDGTFLGTVWYSRGDCRIWFTYNRGGRMTAFFFRGVGDGIRNALPPI